MDEDEFTKESTRMVVFQCAELGESAGLIAASTFYWAVWASTAFPEWWAKWQAAVPRIEAIAGQENIEAMKRQVYEALVKPGGEPA